MPVPFKHRVRNNPRLFWVLQGGLSGLLGRILALLVSAVTLPLTFRSLGDLEYGIWVTVSTSVLMLSVLDLGIANTLTNLIAEASAEDDSDKAQRYDSTAFWVSVGIALSLLPIAFVLWVSVNWGGLFHLSDDGLSRNAALCVAISTGFFLVPRPLTLANRVLSGYQQVHLANHFTMLNSVPGFLVIVTAMLLNGSIVTMMTAYSIARLLGTLNLNFWMSPRHKPWMKPLSRKVSRALVRRLFGQGALFFVLQLTGLVVCNPDNLVITHYLGAAAVTSYCVGWKPTQYASLLQGLLVPSLWPAFSEAYQKKDMVWVRTTYRSIRRKTLQAQAVGIATVLIGLRGRTLIGIWVGPAAVPGRKLIWLMALFAFLLACTTNQALLLTATGHLRLEASVAVIAAIANLGLSIYLVQHMGPEGVILSTSLSFALFMVVPQAWEVKRVLSGRYLSQAVQEMPVLS